MSTKKVIRSKKEQIVHLCIYMRDHPTFAAGDFKSPMGAAKSEKEWATLKIALDELGPERSVAQWKTCWRDQKRKARLESGSLNRALNQTGNNTDIPQLSEVSQIILSTIGEEMASGIGPEESPIGFLRPTTPQTPSPRYWLTTPPIGSNGSPIFEEQPEPSGSQSQSQPSQQQRRVRKQAHPSDKFLEAQKELNELMKGLIAELKHSNELKIEHNQLLENQCQCRRGSGSPN